MKIIAHRRNSVADLLATPTQYGVEVDIRSHGQELIIHHDPFVEGLSFENWLNHYQHGTLILNVKEEGLEERLIRLMQSRGCEDYFFLDQSFPYLMKWSGKGEKRCAVRVSEFESTETALSLVGRVNWVWVDCFTRFPLTGDQAKQLQKAGLRLCLVSPELQGRNAETEIPALIEFLKEEGVVAEAVCTKRPDLWNSAQ
jgi:hypothetical protein